MAVVAITLPAPYEASDGRIEGRAPAATTDVGVYVSGDGHYRLVTMHHLARGGQYFQRADPAGFLKFRFHKYIATP